MKRDKLIVANTMLLGTIAIVLSSGINLLIVPFITRRLGVEAYGFVTLARTISDYAGIVLLALNSFSSRYMSISYMQGNDREFSQYFNTVFFGNLALGAILFVIGIAFSCMSSLFFNIPTELSADIPILFIMVFLSSYLMFVSTAFQSITYSVKRLDLFNGIRIASLIVQALLLVILFSASKGNVIFVGIAFVGQYFTVFLLSIIVKLRFVPDLHIRSKDFSSNHLKNLLTNGVWNSVNQVGNVLNSGLDLWITNIFLTAEMMGMISITKTIGGLFTTFNQTISQAFQPNFLQLYSENRTEELMNEFIRAMKICGAIANTVFIAFIVLGKSFFQLWVPLLNSQKLYFLSIMVVLPALFEGYVCPLGYIYTLKAKNKVPCYVTIVGGVLNVLGMIILLNTTSLGEYAILGTTTVIMCCIYLWFNPVYMARCLEVKRLFFYPQIIKNTIAAVVPICFFYFIQDMFPEPSNWGWLIVYGILLGILLMVSQSFVLLGVKQTLSYFDMLIRRRNK